MAASRTYNVFQFTDSHLSADPAACIRGVNTTDSLKAVTALANAFAPPDAIVATGDLSHDGSAASYLRFREVVSQPNIPLRWLPGNHDDAATMQRCSVAEAQPLRLGNWHIITLDSQVLGAEQGALDAESLGRLEGELAAADVVSEYVLLCVHHNPLRTGAKWMDTIDLSNGSELLAMLNKHPSARALIHGHIHHKFERVVGDVQVLGTPSTCAQFAPQATDFEIDTQPATCQPGFRWLRLHPDGTVETGIERVAADTFPPTNAASPNTGPSSTARTNAPYVLYLHGFLSSPQSLKAKQAFTYCQQHGIDIDIPALTEGPAATIAALRERLEAGIARTGGAVLIGSSLGGYYATYLANHYGLRAALINPVVRPYLLLRDYLGEQRNYHTGAVHEVTQEQMQELLDVEVETLATPENFRVMLQTGDETLDYTEAAIKYAGSSPHIHQGGDHSYQGFDNELPQLFAFLLSRTATKAR